MEGGRGIQGGVISYLALFAIIENGHYTADQVTFQKISKFGQARVRRTCSKISISENHRNLKNDFFPENLQ